MITRFKIILIALSLITPTILMGHKVTLEDKSLEEIVNNRMALMQKVKSTSSQIFKLLKTNDYEAILELNEKLLHAATEFKDYYPEGSQYKGASEEIWNDRETFNELNDKFVNDIEMISLSAELEDSEMLNDAFKVMAANCGACHKKFRN
ncbi:cytochrome c [Pelagibacteraceae bacterium]|nr:cytochrome c [Pelagibacteraceae bacterium]